MIPEPDQIFTEIELSTLQKAINETEVSAAAGGDHSVGDSSPAYAAAGSLAFESRT